jgi:diphosphomevalonate decarboxylase
MGKATAVANPNIAFIKYWGKAESDLNLPANPSLSMNLASLVTTTTVEFRPRQRADTVTIDDELAAGQARDRVVTHLDRVRVLAGTRDPAWVVSRNGFPPGTGLASSASAFAALSLAATQAAGLELDEVSLSRLARLGSGSACRSVPAGFCLWRGDSDETSFALPIASPEHWDLRDVMFHEARLAAVPGLLSEVRSAIERRDLEALGSAIEADALAMHGVMLTSSPTLLYWQPATVAVLRAIRVGREEGLSAFFTMDAGPNVHCICEPADATRVESRLKEVPGVEDVLVSGPGDGVRPVDYHLF